MLPLPRLVNVLAVAARRAVAGGATDDTDRKRRLADFDAMLDWPVNEEERRRMWGSTSEALAEQSAMMAMLGAG